MHPETAVDPATAAAIRQHCEERVLVNVVVTFAEAFRAVLVGRAEAVVRLAAQTYESVTAPFYLEQARGPLVESLACDATRFCGRPRASGYTGADVFFLVIITAFSREPLRPVPEIVLAAICTYEIVDAVAGKCDVRRICVHLAVLEHGPLDVSTIETAHSISTNERSSDILCLINSVICAKYINIENQLTCLRSRSRIPAYGAWRTDRRRSRCGGAGRRSRAPCSTSLRTRLRQRRLVGGTACC